MMVSSVAFLVLPTHPPTYLPANNPQAAGCLLVGNKNSPYLCINQVLNQQLSIFLPI